MNIYTDVVAFMATGGAQVLALLDKLQPIVAFVLGLIGIIYGLGRCHYLWLQVQEKKDGRKKGGVKS